MIKFTGGSVSKIAILVVAGGVALARPVYAADTSTDQAASQSGDMKPEEGLKRVDERIKELHDTLNVTPAQEPQWRKVSRVMQKNEASIHKLVEARNEKESATAVEDLKSYEAITHAHDQGLKKLIPVFEKFYKGLSEDQRASADDMFGKYEGHEGSKSGRAASPETMTPAAGDNGTAAPADNNVYGPTNTDNKSTEQPK
jgi:protein CpxP